MVLSTFALVAVAAMAMGAIAPVPPRERKFETLFDGDEIDGKFYGLGEGVTGLDAPTAEYLLRAGRLAEVDDTRWQQLTGDSDDADAGETDEEREAREAEEKADAERLEAAHADFNEGRIPDDLIDPAATGGDKLLARNKLDELAKAANATVKSSMTKAEVAAAIMAARAKAEASASS